VKEKVILVALPLSVRKFLDLLGTDLDPSVKIKKSQNRRNPGSCSFMTFSLKNDVNVPSKIIFWWRLENH
jgi:hypothetical protein